MCRTCRNECLAKRNQVTGRCNEKRFMQACPTGLPRCLWLGLGTRMAEDHATALHNLQHLSKDVARDRQKALSE